MIDCKPLDILRWAGELYRVETRCALSSPPYFCLRYMAQEDRNGVGFLVSKFCVTPSIH
jgi:hypothetical protein